MSNKIRWGRFSFHMNSIRNSMMLGTISFEQYDMTWDAIAELLGMNQDDILHEIDQHWESPEDQILN